MASFQYNVIVLFAGWVGVEDKASGRVGGGGGGLHAKRAGGTPGLL